MDANENNEPRLDDHINEFEEDDDENEVLVTIGFVQKPKNSNLLLRQCFPGKAGDVPAWLDPVNLPSGKTSRCDICGDPLQFLLQVYAPISEKDSTFHRTLFVFMCPSMACLLRDQHEQWRRGSDKPSRSVKVFRCQLPRANAFYKFEPPRYDGLDKPSGIGAPHCNWCGTWKGSKLCSGCKIARYCSEKHQVMYWNNGHKLQCQNSSFIVPPPEKSVNADGSSPYEIPKDLERRPGCRALCSLTCGLCHVVPLLFQRLWGVIVSRSRLPMTLAKGWCCFNEAEDYADEGNSILFLGLNSPVDILHAKLCGQISRLYKNTKADDDKKSWAMFQERLSRAPKQVLRYSRDENAEPLWPTPSGRPARADIPNCSYCHGPMTFKFQILPQLLYFFGVKNEVDSLDWATIAVYICAGSCDGCLTYKQEFAWVQLNSNTTS